MKRFLFLSAAIFMFSCGNEKNTEPLSEETVGNSINDSPVADTVVLMESSDCEDVTGNNIIDDDYLKDDLIPVRANFKRINSIKSWSRIDTAMLQEATESGQALFYYSGDTLEKIITRNSGEIRQSLTEYYLLDGKLSFVFEKSYKYKHPYSVPSPLVAEVRNYFVNAKLIYDISNIDYRTPPEKNRISKQETRILQSFDGLLKTTRKKGH